MGCHAKERVITHVVTVTKSVDLDGFYGNTAERGNVYYAFSPLFLAALLFLDKHQVISDSNKKASQETLISFSKLTYLNFGCISRCHGL